MVPTTHPGQFRTPDAARGNPPRDVIRRLLEAPQAIGAPERALWAAILADAVEICVGETPASAEEGMAARRWVEERRTQFGGFSWCCDLLGLDDDAIRERILLRRGCLTSVARPRWLPAHRYQPSAHGSAGRPVAARPRQSRAQTDSGR